VTPAHIYNMIAHDMYMARTYHIAIPDNQNDRGDLDWVEEVIR